MRPFLRRPLSLASTLLLPLLASGCDPTPPPVTIPDPPQVSLRVDEPNTVGKSLKVTLTVSGCDQVQRLEVLDNDVLLKQVPYSGADMVVELQSSELRYSRGISATLSLTARATCNDSRTNVSQAQLATFFPVADVYEPPNASASVVPEHFVADGSGSDTSFLGCVKEGGRSFVYKVPLGNLNNPQKLELPFE